MFSREETEAYKGIHATPALKCRVMELERKEDRAFILKPSFAFALAAILICSVFLVNIFDPSYGIYLDGSLVGESFVKTAPQGGIEAASFMSREVPSRDVEFKIKLKEQGVLTSSGGSLTSTDPKTGEVLGEGIQVPLGKETLVNWKVGFEEETYFLSLYTEGKEEFYALQFDSDGSFALKKN